MERTFTVRQVEGGVPLKCWTKGVPVEDKAIEQLERVARMPFIVAPIAVMPDVHVGKGSTVGSVIATSGAIIPAAVGVDIGCGIIAQRTTLVYSQLPVDLSGLRLSIESEVPHGRTDNGGSGDIGSWKELPQAIVNVWNEFLADGYGMLVKKYPRLDRGPSAGHLGTLGTGNHFIEISIDEEDRVWVVIHSGSRGVGNRIGTDFTRLARELARQWFIDLPDPDLSYLPEGTEAFNDYYCAVKWAQHFARINRQMMLLRVLSILPFGDSTPMMEQSGRDPEEYIDCFHNYVDLENHQGKNMLVTRKGAIRAREGDLGIIPGSMGARSFIVRGLGSPDSLQSCSHGAGRAMSRTDALKRFTVADHVAATQGIECAKNESVLDETPGSYKDIDAVMHAQRDLAAIVHTLHQVVCVKGGKDRT